MKHCIKGLTEVQKNYICLALPVDGLCQFMYSTDELCVTRKIPSEAMLIRV